MFIVNCNLAFSIVRQKSFRELMDGIGRFKIEMPSTTTLVKTLQDQYEEMKAALIKRLAAVEFVCTSLDIWTCRGKSYVGMTVHFIDNSLKRHSYLLAFKQLTKRHTYDYLAEIINSIHNEFELKYSQIQHVVTDGGSNFAKCFRCYSNKPNTNIFEMENENDVTDAESDSEQNQIETGDERTEREEDGENENGTFDDSPVTSESIDFDEMNIELQSLQRIQTNSDDESDDEFQITSSNQRSSRLILPNQFRCLAHLLNLVATTWLKKNCNQALKTILKRIMIYWKKQNGSGGHSDVVH